MSTKPPFPPNIDEDTGVRVGGVSPYTALETFIVWMFGGVAAGVALALVIAFLS
jgi:hypothetical protein